MEKFKCRIDSVRFHNEENGFTILACIDPVTLKTITVKCNGMAYPSKGIMIEVEGEWFVDKYYGEQFVVSSYTTEMPTTKSSIKEYLSSGLFKGIGAKFAEKIVNKFGTDTINLIQSKSPLLYEVKGIGQKKIDALFEEWDKHEEIRNVMEYLLPYNFSTNLIIKIYKKYGKDTIAIVKENPYRLISDIEGIGFKKADDIAIKLGFDRKGYHRCAYAMQYAINTASEDGDCYLPYNEALVQTANLISVPVGIIANHFNKMVEDKFVILDDNNDVYHPFIYYCENKVADFFKEKLRDCYNLCEIKNSIYDKEIESIEKEIGIEYNEEQKRAIKSCLVNKLTIVTGGPGTGKTTVTLGIIKALSKHNMNIIGGAPTGKAAKRMAEVTGLDAKTIHRLLQYNPNDGFRVNGENPFYEDVIIIDEMSMVNITLMHYLCDAIPENMKVVLIGDVDQLPCIGAGNVLKDIIEIPNSPVVRLNEIFRQAQDSCIIRNAHLINKGKNFEITNAKGDDFFFIQEDSAEGIATTVYNLIMERLPKSYGIKPTDIQLLTPMRINNLGSIIFNNGLQERINHNFQGIKHGDYVFKKDDIVMQIKNNYDKEIFNGDTGVVKYVDIDNKTLTVDFDGQEIDYDSHDLDELMLAYACTIHKSQGSEYPIVVIPIHGNQRVMLQRNLIYTAITRAKKLCVIVGDINAFGYAIRNNETIKRRTKLTEKICA